jgi:uncharacterized GH25 family protein
MNTLILEKIQRQCTEKLAALLALWLLSAGLCAPALAHDFWIEPESFRPMPGARVPLRVYVGQNFAGDSIPYFPDRFERYVSVGPTGEHAIPGVLGDDPAGAVTAAAPGVYILALRTKPDKVSFDTSEEFERYLRAEGLERHLARHQSRHKPGKVIHETYFRCAKSLLAAGNIRTDAADKALGLPLELIAETNPYQLGNNRRLRLRLLYLNKPLEVALVILTNKVKPLDKLKARTDAHGRVEFSLPLRGVWLATSVHLIPAPFLSRYDWESLWASLTFELP